MPNPKPITADKGRIHSLAYADQDPPLQLDVGQPTQAAWLRTRNQDTWQEVGGMAARKRTIRLGILAF